MVAFNEENIKKNNEIMRKNWEALGKMMQPVFKEAIRSINNSLEQLRLMNQKGD